MVSGPCRLQSSSAPVRKLSAPDRPPSDPVRLPLCAQRRVEMGKEKKKGDAKPATGASGGAACAQCGIRAEVKFCARCQQLAYCSKE